MQEGRPIVLLALRGLVPPNVLSSARARGQRDSSQANVPMRNPLEAPENRPSVIRHVESPRPAPIRAPVGPAKSRVVYTISYPLRENTYQASRERCKHISKDTGKALFHLGHARGPLWSLIPEDHSGSSGDLSFRKYGVKVVLPNSLM